MNDRHPPLNAKAMARAWAGRNRPGPGQAGNHCADSASRSGTTLPCLIALRLGWGRRAYRPLEIAQHPAESVELVLDIVLSQSHPPDGCVDGNDRFAQPAVCLVGKSHHVKVGAALDYGLGSACEGGEPNVTHAGGTRREWKGWPFSGLVGEPGSKLLRTLVRHRVSAPRHRPPFREPLP